VFINQFNLYISLLEIIDTLYLFKLMQIVDPHTVSVNGKLYTARNILIAVGGRPSMPNIQGIEHVIDSDAARFAFQT
jgi:pyruvate/2-oxoglutarate dehydrogenase complex dihydrolipoamide dehydrogenase (E3) component